VATRLPSRACPPRHSQPGPIGVLMRDLEELTITGEALRRREQWICSLCDLGWIAFLFHFSFLF